MGAPYSLSVLHVLLALVHCKVMNAFKDTVNFNPSAEPLEWHYTEYMGSTLLLFLHCLVQVKK